VKFHGHLGLVLVTKFTKIIASMKKSVVSLLAHINLNAKTLLEMVGMVVTLKLEESNTARTLGLDVYK